MEAIMTIYRGAVEFMKRTNNPNQWIDGYPSRELLERDITLGQLFVCRADERIVAVFCHIIGDDATYAQIDGQWLNDEPYGTVHRIASSGEVSRIADFCLEWCFVQHPNQRIDTHADNTVMQRVILRNGYKECGTIICSNGTPRVAYQRV